MPQERSEESLFRESAIVAFSERNFGRPIARQPKVWTAFGCLAFGIVIIAAIVLVTSTYARKESAVGWLVPGDGLSRILTTRGGLVVALNVMNGDEVEKGDVLTVIQFDDGLTIDGKTSDVLLRDLQREREELEKQVKLAFTEHLTAKAGNDMELNGVNQEVILLRHQIASQEQRVLIAKDLLDRFAGLIEDGVSSTLETERQRDLYLQHLQSLDRMKIEIAHLESTASVLKNEQLELLIARDKTLSDLEIKLLSISQRISEWELRGRLEIRAPVRGTVTAINVASGTSVVPNQLLLTVLPSQSKMFAEIYVPSRAAGLIKKGRPVRLMYDAFPHQTFGAADGTVVDISNSVLRSEEIPSTLGLEESAYRAKVALRSGEIEAFGETFQLKPEMTLRAEIILEEQSFIDWLLN